MKISIPWPRPVGVASDAETLIVELADLNDETMLRSGLQAQMPAGITITDAKPLEGRKYPQPTEVRYRVTLGPDDATIVASKSRSIQEASSLPIERVTHRDGRRRTFDARPYFTDMHLETNALEFTLKVMNGTSPRPAEVATLLGLNGPSAVHRFRRLHIVWENGG